MNLGGLHGDGACFSPQSGQTRGRAMTAVADRVPGIDKDIARDVKRGLRPRARQRNALNLRRSSLNAIDAAAVQNQGDVDFLQHGAHDALGHVRLEKPARRARTVLGIVRIHRPPWVLQRS